MNKFVALGIVVAILVVAGPLITIWSVNTLFNTNIDYNFDTWLAAAFMTSLLTGNRYVKG